MVLQSQYYHKMFDLLPLLILGCMKNCTSGTSACSGSRPRKPICIYSIYSEPAIWVLLSSWFYYCCISRCLWTQHTSPTSWNLSWGRYGRPITSSLLNFTPSIFDRIFCFRNRILEIIMKYGEKDRGKNNCPYDMGRNWSIWKFLVRWWERHPSISYSLTLNH